MKGNVFCPREADQALRSRGKNMQESGRKEIDQAGKKLPEGLKE